MKNIDVAPRINYFFNKSLVLRFLWGAITKDCLVPFLYLVHHQSSTILSDLIALESEQFVFQFFHQCSQVHDGAHDQIAPEFGPWSGKCEFLCLNQSPFLMRPRLEAPLSTPTARFYTPDEVKTYFSAFAWALSETTVAGFFAGNHINPNTGGRFDSSVSAACHSKVTTCWFIKAYGWQTILWALPEACHYRSNG